MIFAIMILLTALLLSTVAAFYSVTGLTAIFPGAMWAIIIMGSTLEIAKITATVWLHKYWSRSAIQFKLYLVPAILVLMIITSTGIFGFLSKAHMDQTVPAGDISANIQILDEKITTIRTNIETNKTTLQQMDEQVNQTLSRTQNATNNNAVNRSVSIRRSQTKERNRLQLEITKYQKEIIQIQETRAPLAAEMRKVEAEVGPIKYIAALIYGDNPDANLLERAVRWVIILLVFVFDPLAIVLILAADQTFAWVRIDKQKKKEQDALPEIDNIQVVPDIQLEPASSMIDTEEEFFNSGKEIANKLDALTTHAYLKTPWTWSLPTADPTVGWIPKKELLTNIIEVNNISETERELAIAVNMLADMQDKQIESDRQLAEFKDEIDQIKSQVITDHLGNAINVVYTPKHLLSDQVVIPDLSINADTTTITTVADFGLIFPKNPIRGDLYLRVDYLPPKLYKWNGIKWIQVDKTTTEIYSYNKEYIKHLVDKISLGEYELDQLTLSEQEQIQEYINLQT